jgi:ankyrin repeat protein
MKRNKIKQIFKYVLILLVLIGMHHEASAKSFNNDCEALLHAVKNNNVKQVKTLLKSTSPDCLYQMSDPRTPLVMAAREGHLEIAKLLIQAGANVNKHASGDETPLMAASGNGNLGLVQFLIAKGASINKRLSDNGTALLIAAKHGNTEVVSLLISKRAKVDVAIQGNGTPLICAVRNEHYDVAKILLEHGANPNKISRGDENAMYHAYASNNKKMIELLSSYSKN